jgi:uncharacterized protein (TIGR02996 family)
MSPQADLLTPFLDDIVGNPDDPSLWLILADWLEDREDPRAELLRLTWQLQHEKKHRQFKSREARVQELLAGGMLPVVPRLSLDGGFEFAWIPPGSFLMGSPDTEARRFSNETQHPVRLTRGFYLGIHLVTQGQWEAVMGNNPASFARTGQYQSRVKRIAKAKVAKFPVESVSWNEMQEFCRRLSGRLRRRIGLPSEAQWEYACRAGTTTTFHFGNSHNATQGNCKGIEPYGTNKKGPYLDRLTPVGSYPPMRGASTTCTATSTNSARTPTRKTPTPWAPSILWSSAREGTAAPCAAVAGSTPPGAAEPPSATAWEWTTASSTTASG